MKTAFFTIAEGYMYEEMARVLATRLHVLDGVNIRILDTSIATEYFCHGESYWLKAYLWNMVSSEVERIVFIDADMYQKKKLPFLSERLFSARLDWWKTGTQERAVTPIFKDLYNYFNTGFFTATRESMPVFKRIQAHRHEKPHGNCIEQTWFNYEFAREVIHILPKTIARFVDNEKSSNEDIFDHYAGGTMMKQRYFREIS